MKGSQWQSCERWRRYWDYRLKETVRTILLKSHKAHILTPSLHGSICRTQSQYWYLYPKWSNSQYLLNLLQNLIEAPVPSLIYAILGMQPDISFAVQHLSQFMMSYGPQYWTMTKYMLRYPKNTPRPQHYIPNRNQTIWNICGLRLCELGWCLIYILIYRDARWRMHSMEFEEAKDGVVVDDRWSILHWQREQNNWFGIVDCSMT